MYKVVEHEIRLDSRRVVLKLDDMVRKTPELSRLILGRLGEEIRRKSVVDYLSGQSLKRVTGTLAKSVDWKMEDDWLMRVGSNIAYAAIHEYGGEILPVKGQYLKFKTPTGWVTTSRVVIPARPWLSPAVNDTFNTTRGQSIIDNTTSEWISRRGLDDK